MSEQTEVHRSLGRIEGQLAHVIEMLKGNDARHLHHDARYDSTDKRVGAVERRQAWYSGAAAAVGAIAGFVFRH